MRCRNQCLALCLLLVVSTVAQAAFKFVSWADNRPSLGATTQANFHWVVLEMNRILCPPASPDQWPLFHIVPGDYDYTAQTSAELNSYSDFPAWYLAPGNHDDNIGSSSNHSMDYQNARFIFLNEYVCPASICSNSAGRVCPHILAWLDGQLTNTPRFVFVVGHEPAFPQNRHVGDSLDLYPPDRDAFWNLINARGVYAYLCGHTHFYSTYSNGAGPTVQIDMGNAGNPGDPEQTFVLFEVTDAVVNRHTYQGLYSQPFDGGTPGTPATNPSPTNGASGVSLDTLLSWTAGSGAQSHNVYLSTVSGSLGQTGTLIYAGSNSSCPAPGLAYGTTYYWRVDEVQSGGGVVAGTTWSFTTRLPLSPTVSHIASETRTSGSVAGSFSALRRRENIYEAITEVLNVQNKNAYSTLEHVWRFDNVPTGANVQLRVEAYQSTSSDGDNFALSYSTDGLTYTSLLIISKTWDNNGEQIGVLPANLQGTVWIKARDTDHTRKNQRLDTLYVDCLYIVSSDGAIPAVVVPDESGSQPPGATMHVADLDGVASLKNGPSQWTAQVTVKVVNEAGNPVAGATVAGTWSGAVGLVSTGVTGTAGTVTFNSGTLKVATPATFTVSNVIHSTLIYAPAANTDPDGDSNGTTIVVSKP